MVEAATESASIERREEAQEDPKAFVTYWNKQLSASSKQEKDWRDKADKAVKRFRGDAGIGDAFNILHSNVSTIVPAVYNSTPIPDIRPRYDPPAPLMPAAAQDQEAVRKYAQSQQIAEVARKAAQVIERAISYSVDEYDFDAIVKEAIRNNAIAGRGVTRIRYNTFTRQDEEVGEELAWEEVPCEHVPWRSFRRGPGSTWPEVPWEAFERFLTIDDLDQLTGDRAVSDKIPRGSVDEMSDAGTRESQEATAFKKAKVWEIWDKDSRKVIFIAEGYDEPVAVLPDPLGLLDFFPNPAPLQAISDPDTLTPIVPFEIYRRQAEELSKVSERILRLVEMMKFRGIRASELAEFDQINTLQDGQFAPSQEAVTLLSGNVVDSLDATIWVVPIDKLIVVLRELIVQRDQIKQSIYEITGIADIMRGITAPSETLGAQQIKASWGSLRIQDQQADVERYCREIFRLKAEIIGNKFSPETLSIMVGEEIDDEVLQVLRHDPRRSYLIDVETDSTIRSDLTRSQQNMGEFLTGSAQFFQGFIPLLQSGALPPQIASVAVTVYSAFARQFRLGKQVEDALTQLGQATKQLQLGNSDEEDETERLEREERSAGIDKTRAQATQAGAQALKTVIEAGQQPNGASPP